MIQRARRTLARIIDLGITPELAAVDRKHVRLTNTLVLIWTAITLLMMVVNFSKAHPALRVHAWIELVAACSAPLALYLNARGKHYLAMIYACVLGITFLVFTTLLEGQKLDPEYYLLIFAVLPFLIFPQRHLRTALVFCGVALASIVLLAAFGNSDPWVGPPYTPEELRNCMTLALGLLGVLFAAIGYYSRRATEHAENEIAEKERLTEQLLLNVLPAEIVARLKTTTGAIAERFDDVTVLFADLVGFTSFSEKLAPEQVVDFLNVVFSELDRLTERHGLEKIKTIGDAYMAAAGLPKRQPAHAAAVANFALDALAFASSTRLPDGAALRMRIGIHTGPVVAGVIGEKKFIFDMWGDTVNTASRMESHGEPGEIQITAASAEVLAGDFTVEPRGTISVKGKGPMETFWLRGRKCGARAV
jgi:class 3 adenylate cyclase